MFEFLHHIKYLPDISIAYWKIIFHLNHCEFSSLPNSSARARVMNIIKILNALEPKFSPNFQRVSLATYGTLSYFQENFPQNFPRACENISQEKIEV